MGRKYTPAQKRAISTLRNSGLVFQVIATPSAPAVRTFATKAERLAGKGFTCPQCARNDLRVAPKSGSFHEKDQKTDARDKVICTLA